MRFKVIFSTILTLSLCFQTAAGIFSQSVSSREENVQTPRPKKFKVVLDAGHGGKDGGTAGNGLKEKDIALSIVLKLGKELEKQDDIEVIYTRKTDVFLELWERADIANEAEADLFISVHCNSAHHSAYGTETWVLGVDGNKKNMDIAKKENSVIFLEDNFEKRYEGFDPNKPESTIGLELMQEEFLDQSLSLASYVENEFKVNVSRKSRGVKQNIFWVLHRSVMPSILIETGFISNSKEGKFLNSKSGQDKMAKAISRAVTKYKQAITANQVQDVLREDVLTEKEEDQIYPDITFKVQLAASSRKLATKPYNFKGLQQISRDKAGKLYKYYYGKTSNYREIKQLLDTAKAKGYTSAFIVSFDKKNIKVPLKQVLN